MVPLGNGFCLLVIVSASLYNTEMEAPLLQTLGCVLAWG